jgi:F420-non-reducing hydrogenase iron-sulfur subunit
MGKAKCKADYNPKLVCFTCGFGWGYLNSSGYAKDLENVIPVLCSGKVNTEHIMEAFRKGADGVLILGCPDGDCHFQNGNYQARKRVLLMHKTLQAFGIEPDRLMIKLNMDPEGALIPTLIEEMRDHLANLGPLSSVV